MLHRAGKEGLGRGLPRRVRLGASSAATTSSVEMDADGSHQPEQLPAAARGAGPAPTWCSARAGSRAAGSRTGRCAASCCPAAATPTPALALGIPLRDATGGFRPSAAPRWRRWTWTTSPRRATASRSTWPGGRCSAGCGSCEVPITFVERVRGEQQDERLDRAGVAGPGHPWGVRHRRRAGSTARRGSARGRREPALTCAAADRCWCCFVGPADRRDLRHRCRSGR